jgi:hypothetical protein
MIACTNVTDESFQTPEPIKSTGPYMMIYFHTDDSIHWKGFSASYVLAEAPVDQFQVKVTSSQKPEDRFKARVTDTEGYSSES